MNVKAFVAAVVLLGAPAVSASGIDGIWDVDTNNTSVGTLTFADGGTAGVLRIDGYEDALEKIQVTPAGVGYSTQAIRFVRTGTWYQLYEAVISTNGCLMTGYLIDLNSQIAVLDRFPFWAKKRNCSPSIPNE
jgi:hypothetical protein